MSELPPLPSVDPSGGADRLNPRAHVPAPPPLNAVRQGIQGRLDELDRKEREIFLERLELKSRWNRSLRITQLPNEILILIFVYSSHRELPSSDEDDGDYFKFAPARSQLMKLMLVCRRWCEVSRATPALWRMIDVGKNKSWMKLGLARSDRATVDISFSSNFDESHAAILEPHYHRLRSLRLQCWSPIALPVIRAASLPKLESLEITSNPETRSLHGRIHVEMDLGITLERFPNLRTVQVSHTTIPRDPLFYTRLSRLSLKGCPFQPSLEQFLHILSHSPSLRHLELDDFLQQLSGCRPSDPTHVLSSLRSLRLNNHRPMYSARFLSRIVIPSASLSVTADIDIDPDDWDQSDVWGDTLTIIVPSNLKSTLPQLTGVTRATLKVSYARYAIECHPTTLESGETPLVSLALTSPDDQSNWEGHLPNAIADLLTLFGSIPLTHLKVEGFCESAGVPAWNGLFQDLPSLVSLETDADDMAVPALFECSRVCPIGGQIVCPALECLIFNDQERNVRVDFLFGLLELCLLCRAERGARLKEVRLELHQEDYVLVREKYLPKLETLVSNVVFGNAWAKNNQR